MILLKLVLVVTLLIILAFLSAAETAVTAASPGRMLKLQSQGNKNALLVLGLLKIKEKIISSFLIANSIINTVCTTIATALLISLYGSQNGMIISSVVMSILIIIFAEVLPKSIALAKSEAIVLKSSYVIRGLLWIMRPINKALALAIRGFCKLFRIDLNAEMSGTEEVRGMIEHHHQEGNVFKADRDMLGGVLDIRDMRLDEIMIHRSDMLSVDMDLEIKDIVSQAMKTTHSRVPLWQDNKDNIVGILHMRSLLTELYSVNYDLGKLELTKFVSKPWFVPDNTLVSQQLHSFRNKRNHFAVVVDEYGDLQGIVTLEDILEEIVGQIDDEHDSASRRIVNKGKNKFLFDASISIRDLNRELNWNLPDENASTFAGLIMHDLERLPEQGERFELLGLGITVRKKYSNRIQNVFVERLEPTEDEELSQ